MENTKNNDESRNFFMLADLVMDVGALVSRRILLGEAPLDSLHSRFHNLLSNPDHRKKFYPNQLELIRAQPPKPEKFDISLTVGLIRLMCPGIQRPTKGWDSSPDSTDTSTGADLKRLLDIRNNQQLLHAPSTSLIKSDFDKLWKTAEDAIQRLSRGICPEFFKNVQDKIQAIKTRWLGLSVENILQLKELFEPRLQENDLLTQILDQVKQIQLCDRNNTYSSRVVATPNFTAIRATNRGFLPKVSSAEDYSDRVTVVRVYSCIKEEMDIDLAEKLSVKLLKTDEALSVIMCKRRRSVVDKLLKHVLNCKEKGYVRTFIDELKTHFDRSNILGIELEKNSKPTQKEIEDYKRLNEPHLHPADEVTDRFLLDERVKKELMRHLKAFITIDSLNDGFLSNFHYGLTEHDEICDYLHRNDLGYGIEKLFTAMQECPMTIKRCFCETLRRTEKDWVVTEFGLSYDDPTPDSRDQIKPFDSGPLDTIAEKPMHITEEANSAFEGSNCFMHSKKSEPARDKMISSESGAFGTAEEKPTDMTKETDRVPERNNYSKNRENKIEMTNDKSGLQSFLQVAGYWTEPRDDFYLFNAELGSMWFYLKPRSENAWNQLKENCLAVHAKEMLAKIISDDQMLLRLTNDGCKVFMTIFKEEEEATDGAVEGTLVIKVDIQDGTSQNQEEINGREINPIIRHMDILCEEMELTDELICLLQKDKMVGEDIRKNKNEFKTRAGRIKHLLTNINEPEKGYEIIKEYQKSTRPFLYKELCKKDQRKLLFHCEAKLQSNTQATDRGDVSNRNFTWKIIRSSCSIDCEETQIFTPGTEEESQEGGEIPGGDMVDPDIADWIKFERQNSKYYVALKGNKMCFYQTIDNYYMASPIHEIEMKLAAVKEIERTKLQLNTHYAFCILIFESSFDASNWKDAIEESITNASGDDTVLNQVKEANPDNATCADCKAKDAHWASMNLGIVLCLKCAGIHRGFELRLSKVRSLRMDCKIWNSSLLEMFRVIGNKNSNQFWSWNMPQGSQIDENTPLDIRKEHIHNKYKNKLYCDLDPLSTNKEDLNEALLSAAQTNDVLLTLKILFSGADVLYHRPGEPDTTAFELAKAAHQRIQMEFLLQNGGDKTQNFTPGTEEEALVAKLRGEIQHQGYLQKTGPNMKDFLKRWCVLEHGHLSFYLNEESKVEKDRIENDTIQCLQAVRHDKNPFCIEISCSKKNGSHRVFLFAATSHEDRLQWMRKISQVFCPVSLMDHVKEKEMALAGYVFMKFGFNLEWQKSWVLLENRTLYYCDKNNTEGTCDSVDLRKVTSLVKITTTTSACASCLESGPQFVLHVPEKALYFQAALVKDTERMFGILQTTAKQGGDTLEDQLLNTNNVPIIIHSCIDFIEANGMRLKGIYREAAQNSKVQAILDKFKEDARSVVLKIEEHTVHEVCNALKRFLRNLSDPLLTAKLYAQWIGTAGKFTGKSHTYNMLEWYRYLLNQLPRTNYLTLKCIAAHLWKLSKHSSENLMTLDNISIAFGSTLMTSATAEGSATVAEVNAGRIGNNMQLEMKVISDIVTHYEDLFDVYEAEARQKRIDDEIRKAEEKMKGARLESSPPEPTRQVFKSWSEFRKHREDTLSKTGKHKEDTSSKTVSGKIIKF